MNLELKKQTKKWRNIAIILVCFIFILILSNFAKKDIPADTIFDDSIAEIEITGIIDKDDYRNSKITEITNNNKIKAVIINIDSPGGMVTPSEVLYDLIFKLNQVKPVVVVMDGMATSGAYMVALGSDYLIAKNTTLTGSIGVLLQSFEVVELAKKLGIEIKTYKSSELKGMPSYIEKNNERSNLAIQSTIDDVYRYFVDLVKERRVKLTEENFKLATNGQAFTGRQALKIGIIDEIGDKDSALKYLGTRSINIKLPIRKVNLKKKVNMSFFHRLANKAFLNLEEKTGAIGIEDSSLFLLGR